MRNYITHEWFTIFTIFGILAITAAKYLNALRFNDFISVIGNSTYLKIHSKAQKFIDPFDGLIFINLVFSGSIFLYFSYATFIAPITFELIVFLKLLFAVAAIVIIKTLSERLIGSLFEIDSIVDGYLFQKITFLNYSGFVLVITNLLLLYADVSAKIVIITAFTLIFLINLIGFITSFKNYQKIINPNFFYFLLYLCALEIAPYVLLYKVFSEYNV